MAAAAPSAPTASPIGPGQLAVLGAGDVVASRPTQQQDERSPALEVLVLGGPARSASRSPPTARS